MNFHHSFFRTDILNFMFSSCWCTSMLYTTRLWIGFLKENHILSYENTSLKLIKVMIFFSSRIYKIFVRITKAALDICLFTVKLNEFLVLTSHACRCKQQEIMHDVDWISVIAGIQCQWNSVTFRQYFLFYMHKWKMN